MKTTGKTAKQTAIKKPTKKKAASVQRIEERRSVTFASDTMQMLRQLSQENSDFMGRRVSNSSLIRALIRYAASQPPQWAHRVLVPFLEAEVAAGVKWGHESTKTFTER
jgi:hypothetical protein